MTPQTALAEQLVLNTGHTTMPVAIAFTDDNIKNDMHARKMAWHWSRRLDLRGWRREWFGLAGSYCRKRIVTRRRSGDTHR